MNTTTRGVRVGAAAVVALLGCCTTACGSRAVNGRAIPTNATTSSQHSASPGGGGGTPASFRPRGLLLLIDRPSGATVEAIDPHSGAVTGREKFTVPSGIAPDGLTPGFRYTGLAIRNAFNSSITEVAAQGPQQPDGSTAAGELDTHGRFTALTPPTQGYASPKVDVPVGFAPDGRLWFEQQVAGSPEGGFFSVDPNRGGTSVRREGVTTALQQASQSGPSASLFWVGTAGPYSANAVEQDDFLPLPGRTSVSEVLDQQAAQCPDGSIRWGWRVGIGTSSLDNAPLLAASNGCLSPQPVPAWPVDRSRFLTTYGSGPTLDSATQIYDNVIADGQVRATALLPQSSRLVSDVVADPSGTAAAFLSTAGSTESLDTVPLMGGEPRKVLALPVDPQANYILFDWRQ